MSQEACDNLGHFAAATGTASFAISMIPGGQLASLGFGGVSFFATAYYYDRCN